MPLRVLPPVAHLVLLLTLVLLTTTHAVADQQRLFAVTVSTNLGNQTSVSTLVEATLADGRVVNVVPRATVPGRFAEKEPNSLAITGGGRFVVWRQYEPDLSGRLAVFDRVTGQASVRAALPMIAAVWDPTRPRLFSFYQNQIASVSTDGIVFLPNTVGVIPRAISHDGRRVYAVRLEFQGSSLRGSRELALSEIVVLDSTTGRLLRTVPLPDRSWQLEPEMVLSDDESKVWLTTRPRMGDLTIRAFDMISGSQVLAIPLPRSDDPGVEVSFSGLLLDDVGQRVAISLTYLATVLLETMGGENPCLRRGIGR